MTRFALYALLTLASVLLIVAVGIIANGNHYANCRAADAVTNSNCF